LGDTSRSYILINTSKTKELVIGPWGHQRNATSLQTDSGAVDRVHNFKLLGVYVDSTLSWTKHVEHIAKKALLLEST